MHRLVPIYLPHFLLFKLKELAKCKSPNEKRYWAAKAITHISIWLGKRESDFYWKCMMLKSQKACSSNWNKKKKFQASISKWDVLIQNNQMLWIVKKPNEKLQIYVIIFLWEVIYIHFYNWDKSLDLVLVVYNLIELIIETSF